MTHVIQVPPAMNCSEWSAFEIVQAIHSGRVTCETIVRACLDRIGRREHLVHAWTFIDPDWVIAEARKLDDSGFKGMLSGVPFGIKDIIETADLPTEYGSPIYKGYRPRKDAPCVALGRKAGGILMGKTVTTEFANFHPGITRNPLDETRTPGGSSSGSAAAVADYMVPLAIGTQTTASTIRPASFCGVFGYRPTYGHLRCANMMEASGSLDTLGLFARSIEDIALYRDVLMGEEYQLLAAYSGSPRIGLCRSNIWPQVDAFTQTLILDATERLARAGAILDEVNLPDVFDNLTDVHKTISSYEFARNFTWEIENHWDEISPTLRGGRLSAGLACRFDTYRNALAVAERARIELDNIFADYDVLLTAAALGEAPVGLDSTGDPSACIIWTTMHVPAISLPVFKGPSGLPIGLQVIAPRNADRKLLAVARWIYGKLT